MNCESARDDGLLFIWALIPRELRFVASKFVIVNSMLFQRDNSVFRGENKQSSAILCALTFRRTTFIEKLYITKYFSVFDSEVTLYCVSLSLDQCSSQRTCFTVFIISEFLVMLQQSFLNWRDHDVHKAKPPAMCQGLVCHLL